MTFEHEPLSKHRIEALTDGIYAVAMTLLVLELKLPEPRPFSSAMVGEYNMLFRAQALYAANMAVLALLAIWQLSHLGKHPGLCQPPGFPESVARGARFRCWSLVATAVLAAAIAYFEPRFGTLAFMLMFLLGRVGRRLEAKTETTP
jgi:uncharacterized membrane protein